jgi:hypothetical protein
MIFTQIIQSRKIIVECDAALEPAAGDVFATLAGLTRSGSALHEGFRIRFGWSLLSLRADSGGLRVCEPLFSGDPLTELNPTLDITFRVLVEQLQWLRRTEQQGEDISFEQQIVFTHDAFAATEVFALRGQAGSETDSGWSVAPVPAEGGEIDMSHLSAQPVYRLIETHPGLLSILTLPTGALVRLKHDQVVEITGADDRVRWQSPEWVSPAK